MTRTVKMERRHFEMIAETIRLMLIEPKAKELVAREFAARLRATNGRFDVERFLRAAGVH